MEWNIPGWIVSPRWRKRYITAPHERAAKTLKYRGSGGMGFASEVARVGLYGCAARGRKDARTLEMTYNTICSDMKTVVDCKRRHRPVH